VIGRTISDLIPNTLILGPQFAAQRGRDGPPRPGRGTRGRVSWNRDMRPRARPGQDSELVVYTWDTRRNCWLA